MVIFHSYVKLPEGKIVEVESLQRLSSTRTNGLEAAAGDLKHIMPRSHHFLKMVRVWHLHWIPRHLVQWYFIEWYWYTSDDIAFSGPGPLQKKDSVPFCLLILYNRSIWRALLFGHLSAALLALHPHGSHRHRLGIHLKLRTSKLSTLFHIALRKANLKPQPWFPVPKQFHTIQQFFTPSTVSIVNSIRCRHVFWSLAQDVQPAGS